MAELGGTSPNNKKKTGFRATFREKGLIGVVAGVPGKSGGAVKDFFLGHKENTDPKAPDVELRRNEFIIDIDNKTDVVDKHGRRVDRKDRKDRVVDMEKVYPSMEDFWVQHIQNLTKLVNTHPDILNDKTSYIYFQYLQVKAFTSDPGPNKIGQIDKEKLRTYFNTAAGYSETMRYMEEELTRLQQANQIVELTKNKYSPGGLDAVNMGLISRADRLAAIGRLGTGAVASLEALLLTVYFLKTFGAFVPSMLSAIPPAVLTVMGPWAVGVGVAAIPFGLMVRNLDQHLKTNTPEQIMQQCDAMFNAMAHGPQFEKERAYLRTMYAIDPGELRFKPPPLGAPPGSQHQAVFMDGGITTTGWAESKRQILKIKEARRIFYKEVLDIDEYNMFGVPEEAFFDNQGQYRQQTIPEGQAVIFQQEIWNRFNQLGGHFRIDTATGHAQRLNAVEAIQRFQQARREVIMTRIEVNAATVIQVDRRRTLTEQKNVLTKRRADIGATGKARNDEKEIHTKAIELAKDLNEGKDGKDGLKKYAEGWKGPAPESMESRLKGLADTRQEVYTKIATIISWGRPVEEISEVEIQAAIDELQKNRLGKGTKPKVGTLEHRKRALAALIAVEPAQKPTGGKGKGGVDIMGENPELARLKGEYQSVDDEIKKVTAQIEELESLQLKLKNERARYEPNSEHGKAYAENLKKMEDSYKKLEVAAASRVPPFTPADVQDFLLVYPTGSYSVPMAGGSPVPRGGISGLMTTLANEAVPPLWDKDGNALHENKMIVMYAVAYARAQQQIKGVGGSLTAQGGAIYDATSTATIEAFFDAGVASGKFNEMTLLASNATELGKVGTLTLAGGATVNMASGDNDTLRAYARGRFDIYTKAIQELIEEHDKSIQVAEKKGEEIDKKYEVQEARYAELETLISQEEATEESRKINAQVYRRGLTGGESVMRLTNIAPLGASTAQAERDRYLDYEKSFMLKFPDFPRGMLEFLDVIFQYRTNPEGKKLLGTVYELLVDMNHSGLTEDRSPQIMLADMIYESHPSIREMLHITRDEGVAHLTSTGVAITESWDNIVLKAFRNRQIGCPITTPPDIVYKPFIQRPYSTSEMNAIFTSIQHQILQKAVNRGVLVDPSKDYNF